MNNKKQVAIVIPIYKSDLNNEEKLSIQSVLKVLKSHDFIFICSKQLNTNYYENIFPNDLVYKFQYFDNFYFESIGGYNKLLLSSFFYEQFKAYNYILIYQLDCYIFQDNLREWCNKGYDYIGAPWINWDWSTFSARHITFPRRLLYKLGFKNFNLVGNGGLSLRKVNSFIHNLTYFYKAAAKFDKNEDYFFSFYINSFNPFFKIPKLKEALRFSFDVNPGKAYELNNQQLPMGCHAWPKNVEFWKEFIPLNDSN